MVVPKLDKQQVIGALKSTGSVDPDVLYAKKEDLLAESRKVTILPRFAYIVGTAMSLTVVGAVVGVPIILFGRAVSKTIKYNTATADSALSDHLIALRLRSQAANDAGPVTLRSRGGRL
jgi:hypothetical protein